MDALTLLRTFGALTLLLGLLAGALWGVRRYNIRLPGAVTRQPERRLELVERLGIDQRRSAILIRRDDREHLVIVSPEGQVVVETLEARAVGKAPPPPKSSSSERQDAKPLPESFTALLDWNLTGSKDAQPRNAARTWKRKH